MFKVSPRHTFESQLIAGSTTVVEKEEARAMSAEQTIVAREKLFGCHIALESWSLLIFQRFWYSYLQHEHLYRSWVLHPKHRSDIGIVAFHTGKPAQTDQSALLIMKWGPFL